MRNPSSDMCLDTLGKKDDAPLGLYQCHGQGGNQVMKLATSCYLVTVRVIARENREQ